MDVANFYQLTTEQLLDVQQVILKQAKTAFAYVQNKIPSYKTAAGSWASLTGKDPYELAKEFGLELSSIPLKLTDLEGLSVLADQRKFTEIARTSLHGAGSEMLGFSQLSRRLVGQLEAEGFQHTLRSPLIDKVEQSLAAHGKDAFLLMRSLSVGGRWLFASHYNERGAAPTRREDAYVEKKGAYVLNDASRSRLVDYAAGLIDDNPATALYFIEKFHHLCARQGLSISTHVDDSRPETLSASAKHVMEKAFFQAKQNDWDGFNQTLCSLEFKFTPRISSHANGQQVLDKIRQTLKSTSWQALAPVSKLNNHTAAHVDRSEVIEKTGLRHESDLLYKTLHAVTTDKPGRDRLQQHWREIWNGQDISSLDDIDPQAYRDMISKSLSHFSEHLKARHQDIVRDIQQRLAELPQEHNITKILTEQLASLIHAPVSTAQEKLSRLRLLDNWFEPKKVVHWMSQDSSKQASALDEAFYQKVCSCGLAYPLGFTDRQFYNEDVQHQSMMRGIK